LNFKETFKEERPGRVHPSNGRPVHDQARREERRVYGEKAADEAAV